VTDTLSLRTFIAGYASVDDDLIFPLSDHTRSALEAAVSLGGPADLIYEAGRRQATRTALHRARGRLYDRQKPAIVAAVGGLMVDSKNLAVQLALIADRPRATRKAQALTTLRQHLYQQPQAHDAWAQANSQAYRAAVGRGRAEAKATPAGGGPADPAVAGRLTRTEAVNVDGNEAAAAGYQWIDQQLSGLAGDLANMDLPSADDLAKEIQTAVNAAEGPQWWAEEQMVGAWAKSLVDGLTDTNPDRRLYWWTSEDDRVCPTCDAIEGNNPYTEATIPGCPDHPGCRCDIEGG